METADNTKDFKSSTEWIAIDWGTTNVRAWAMGRIGEVLAKTESNLGMARLDFPEEFEAELNRISDELASKIVPVICCGMVGAKQGWQEIPYISAPCKPHTEPVKVKSADRPVWICPGMKQLEPTADVMRGEETQISGLITNWKTFDGVVCLPGTHTKWARVKALKVKEFHTFLTGELFELLAEKSVLRHSIADSGWDQTAFQEAVLDAFENPLDFSSKLFSIRSDSLLNDLDPVIARSRLSGWLIGLEIASAKPFIGDEDAQIVIIGSETLSNFYLDALKWCGFKHPEIKDAESMTLAGLGVAYESASVASDSSLTSRSHSD